MATQSEINLQEQRTIIEQLQTGLARLPEKITRVSAEATSETAVTLDELLRLPSRLRSELAREFDRMDALVTRWGSLERIEQARREAGPPNQPTEGQSQ